MEAGRRRRTSRFPGSPALSLLLQYQVGRVPLRTFVLTFLACFSSSSASFHLSLSLPLSLSLSLPLSLSLSLSLCGLSVSCYPVQMEGK